MHFDNQTGELVFMGGNLNETKKEEKTEPGYCNVPSAQVNACQDVSNNKSIEFGIKIEIDDQVYQKVMHWIDKADFEVSGLGMVEYDQENNVLRVTDAMLLQQKGTGASTELNAGAVAKAMFLTKDKSGSLRWWWHSHVNFSVFWSDTDQTTLRELGGGGWFCATVFNKKREMKSAYCQNAPVRLVFDDMPCEIIEYVDQDLINKWDEEFDKNVTRETFVFSGVDMGGYGPVWDNLPDEMKLRILQEELNDDSTCLKPEDCDNFPTEDDDDYEKTIKEYTKKGFKFDEGD